MNVTIKILNAATGRFEPPEGAELTQEQSRRIATAIQTVCRGMPAGSSATIDVDRGLVLMTFVQRSMLGD